MQDKAFIDAAGVVAGMHTLQAGLTDKRRLWRSFVAIAVLAVHFLVILWMVSAKLAPEVTQAEPHKTQLLWLLLPKKKAPEGVKRPTEKSDIVDQVYKAVQLMDHAPEVARPNAITIDPGLALGQALSCGAGQFEYLTPEGKRRCKYPPWDYTYDRDGYIILRTPRMPPRHRERRIDPRDQMRRQRTTSPPCADGAAGGGAPCIDSMLPHGY